jgi:hypothetical protein
VLEAGKLATFDAVLGEEAIRQQEVVVDARRRDDTEAAILATRKKAPRSVTRSAPSR